MTRKNAVLIGGGLLLSLFLAGVVSFYASAAPDGLEKVATDQGFLATAKTHALEGGPLAGYSWHGIGDARLSGGLAGIAGVLLTLALAGALFTLLGRRRPAAADLSLPADQPVGADRP